jgi:GDP-mannose 6-dehydrogenase
MRISIFGLGYVGTVSAGCLAKDGHEVIGVDTVQTKVDMINAGTSPIIEAQIDDIVKNAVKSGRLKATADVAKAVFESDLSMVCVGTPSLANGRLNLKYVQRVCEQIGGVVREKMGYHTVVIRSTVLPGTMRSVVIPTLEEYSSKTAGGDFGVCVNPEFLREGTAVHDFYHPPKTVIGETDLVAGDLLSSIYHAFDAPLIRTDLETAEVIKYVDNVWHALKIGFANEIGNICKELRIDGHQVMDIFCQDRKLNLSPYYLKPGFAFGGSCLPKDLRALTYKGRNLDLDLPILNSILLSNQRQIEKGLKMIMEKGKKRVGILGFSFKAGTDDLRESPMVEVIERLLGKGYEICIYDKNVSMAKLMGANRDYILNHIPHVSKLMVGSMDEVLACAEILVIGNADQQFREVIEKLNSGQVVVDLVRIADCRSDDVRYDGICW